ncbi:MAG: calcium-binding EGF-like domain-containing protein [Edaphocola sp.]
MKTFLLTAFGLCAVVSATVFTSCKEDKCKSTVCAYGGVCNDGDGSCTCPTGYEGERCETVTRDKFKGAWRVVETGTSGGPAQYAVSVENGTGINDVIIRNFYNKFDPVVTATVKGDTIYIASQQIQVGEDIMTVEGKGYAIPEAYYDLHGKLVLSYKVTSSDGSTNEFGVGTGTNFSVWTK